MQSARTRADAKALSLSQAAVQNRAMSRSIQQGLYAWRRALFMGDGGGDAPPASPGPDKLQTPTEIREEVAELEMLTARRRRTVGLLVRQVAWSAGQSLQRATLASCWSAWRQRLRVGRMQVVLERQASARQRKALRVWAAAVRQQRLERFTTERVRRSVVERRRNASFCLRGARRWLRGQCGLKACEPPRLCTLPAGAASVLFCDQISLRAARGKDSNLDSSKCSDSYYVQRILWRGTRRCGENQSPSRVGNVRSGRQA